MTDRERELEREVAELKAHIRDYNNLNYKHLNEKLDMAELITWAKNAKTLLKDAQTTILGECFNHHYHSPPKCGQYIKDFLATTPFQLKEKEKE